VQITVLAFCFMSAGLCLVFIILGVHNPLMVYKCSYKINLVFFAEILKDILKGISERFKTGISFPG